MSASYTLIQHLDDKYAIVGGVAALSIDKRVFLNAEECQRAIPNAIPSNVYAIIDKTTGEVADGSKWLPSYKQAMSFYKSALQPKQSFCAVEKNPDARGIPDEFHVRQGIEGDSAFSRILYVGAYDECAALFEKLASGEIQPENFVHMKVASACPCYIENEEKHLESMVVLASDDEKIYLGKSKNYDSRGHYFNADNSLCFVSNNYDALDVIADGGALFSQTRLRESGCFTQEELENIRNIGLYVKL